jgi:hypothetical protein
VNAAALWLWVHSLRTVCVVGSRLTVLLVGPPSPALFPALLPLAVAYLVAICVLCPRPCAHHAHLFFRCPLSGLAPPPCVAFLASFRLQSARHHQSSTTYLQICHR